MSVWRASILAILVATLLVPAPPSAAAIILIISGAVSETGPVARMHPIDVAAPTRLVGRLTWSGTANLDLVLFDPAGVRLARARTSSNPEVITFDATVSGTWRFKVRARSGAAAYSLRVDIGTVTTPRPVGDVAVVAGVAEDTRTWSANVGDANGDGIADVLLVRHALPARLYLGGVDGVFRETQVGAFPKNDRHDCDWGDVNLDGRQDLYCSLGAGRGDGVGRNELWIQRADGTFAESAGAWGVADPYGRGRWVTFIDANHDAYPDLFVGNSFPRTDGLLSPNRLFINDRGLRFVERVQAGLTREVGAFCAEAADWNGDGWEDLIVCGDAGIIVYANGAGSFSDVTSSVGVSSYWRSVEAVDLNGDGLLDLAMVKRGRFQVQFQGPAGRFGSATFSLPLVGGRHVAAADWDGDGDPDLYLTGWTTSTSETDITSNSPDILLLNDGTGRFTAATIPQTTRGRGDGAEPLDRDGDGAFGFLVMNGEGDPGKVPADAGPIQLIEA